MLFLIDRFLHRQFHRGGKRGCDNQGGPGSSHVHLAMLAFDRILVVACFHGEKSPIFSSFSRDFLKIISPINSREIEDDVNCHFFDSD